MSKSEKEELENLILKTLSFYEKMDFSKIVLDLDPETLKKFPQFSRDELEKILNKFIKRGFVNFEMIKDERIYWRVHPPKNFLKKIKSIFLK